MTKKKDEKATRENAVELEENELDNVTGGADTQSLNLVDIDGASKDFSTQSAELDPKLGFNEGKHFDYLKSK